MKLSSTTAAYVNFGEYSNHPSAIKSGYSSTRALGPLFGKILRFLNENTIKKIEAPTSTPTQFHDCTALA